MGAATLETPTVAASGRARARDRGAVELVRFLAAPLRYLDALRDDPRGVVPFRLGARPARLVKDLALLEELDWPAPAARPLPGAVADRAARLADSWTEGEPVELVAELRALLDGLPARPPGGRRFGAGRAMLGGGDLTATPARAAALAWTVHLLDRHPDAEARWHAELDETLGGRAAGPADVPALPWTACVLRESMRLFPPVWAAFLPREDHVLVASPWVTHRDPRVWPDPLRFDPDRWGAGAPAGLDAFPFAAPEAVVEEGVLVLAALGQRWALRPAGGRAVRPVAAQVTEPRGGLRMKPVRRS